MGKNQEYENAYNNYIQSIEDYKRESKDAYNKAYENASKYVGDEGYNRALELGKKGAVSATNASIANAINSARASGMNKAQSATMGNQSAINTYNSQLNNQQNNAYSSGTDATNNEYNRASGINSIYGNNANLSGTAMGSQQQEGNNKYDRAWGNIGGIAQTAIPIITTLMSDERLKKYKDISTSFLSKKSDGNDILKYKVDISKYKGEN